MGKATVPGKAAQVTNRQLSKDAQTYLQTFADKNKSAKDAEAAAKTAKEAAQAKQNAIAKTQGQIDSKQADITTENSHAAQYAGQLNTAQTTCYNNQPSLRSALAKGDYSGCINYTEITTYSGQLNKALAKVKQYTADLKTLNDTLKNEKNPKPKGMIEPKPKGSGSSNTAGTTNTDGRPSKYKYNAPMVKSAYFSSTQNAITSLFKKGNGGTPEQFNDALLGAFRFSGDAPVKKNSRGVIQTSAETAQFQAKQTQDTKNKKKIVIPTITPYGFQFHYNPETIIMAYGAPGTFNPEEVMSGNDTLNTSFITENISTIQVTILLNRMVDLSILKQDGSFVGQQVSSNVPKYVQDEQALHDPVTVYGQDVPVEERQEIWKKGTMYDIEYLFKAVHGDQGTYNSVLRGLTSDIGWINAVPVEVHLGDGLRYLARITSLGVNHAKFNERMVPMISFVDLKLSRFLDIKPQTKK
jgi:hypothetical protein